MDPTGVKNTSSVCVKLLIVAAIGVGFGRCLGLDFLAAASEMRMCVQVTDEGRVPREARQGVGEASSRR